MRRKSRSCLKAWDWNWKKEILAPISKHEIERQIFSISSEISPSLDTGMMLDPDILWNRLGSHLCLGIGIIGYCCLFLPTKLPTLTPCRNPHSIAYHSTLYKMWKTIVCAPWWNFLLTNKWQSTALVNVVAVASLSSGWLRKTLLLGNCMKISRY